MHYERSLDELTHVVIDDLQRAYLECQHKPTEGLILSALVKVKLVQDLLVEIRQKTTNIDSVGATLF